MIHLDLIPFIKSSYEPHCPFCGVKMDIWLGGDPPEELQYFCNCANLTSLYSSSMFIPKGEKFPIIDTIQFITNVYQINFLFGKKETTISSYLSGKILFINSLIDFDFKNLDKLHEDLNLYIMLS